MKDLITILLLMITTVPAIAQQWAKSYFDKNLNSSTESDAAIVVVGKTAARAGTHEEFFIDTVKSFYTANERLRSIDFRDANGKRVGKYYFYYPNGKMKETGHYKNDLRIGYVTYYNESGNVSQTLKFWGLGVETAYEIINYYDDDGKQLVTNGNGYCRCHLRLVNELAIGKVTDGLRDSLWQTFRNDTLVLEEEFVKGDIQNVRHFESGPKEVPATFKGGPAKLREYIQEHLHPLFSTRGEIEKVTIGFTVEKDGALTNLNIVKGSSNSANDYEALRMLQNMPRWLPATQNGIPVRSGFVLTIPLKK